MGKGAAATAKSSWVWFCAASPAQAGGCGDQGGDCGCALCFIASKMRFLLPNLCHSSLFCLKPGPKMEWKRSPSVSVNGSHQCQLCSHSWNQPCLALGGISICARAAGSAQTLRNAKSSLPIRAKNKMTVFGWWHSPRIHGKHLPQCSPKPWIPWRDPETPTQGTLGVAWDGHGFVAELLHVCSTGLLSRRPKVFK